VSKPVLGIDVSKDSLDVQFVLGDKSEYDVFGNNPIGHKRLVEWLKKRSKGVQVHVCMEATGMYAFPVAEQLHQASQYVSVVNPARIKAYASCQLARNKTDRLDAAIIADFCRTQNPTHWVPPREEIRELQALVRLLRGLEEDCQAQVNRSKSGVRSTDVGQVLDNLIHYYDEQIKHVEQLIDDHVNQHPDLRHKTALLVSIKGISSKTAHIILGEILYLDSFTDAKQVVAYAGLNPRQRLSGKMKGRSPISKTGNAHLRKALYFPAIVAKTHNPVVHEFCARLESNDLSKMEVIVAAMRKLLHIAFGVLKNDSPFDPNYEQSLQFQPFYP
jgi:transposase